MTGSQGHYNGVRSVAPLPIGVVSNKVPDSIACTHKDSLLRIEQLALEDGARNPDKTRDCIESVISAANLRAT